MSAQDEARALAHRKGAALAFDVLFEPLAEVVESLPSEDERLFVFHGLAFAVAGAVHAELGATAVIELAHALAAMGQRLTATAATEMPAAGAMRTH